MLSASAMSRHEKFCSRNPINQRACYDCKHLQEIKVTIETGEGYFFKKGFYCPIIDKKLYPVAAEKKNLPGRYPETFKDQNKFMLMCCYHEFAI